MKPDDWRLLNDTEFLRNQPLAAMTANEMLHLTEDEDLFDF